MYPAAGEPPVTVIAADDLPDPIYLEGDLAASAAARRPPPDGVHRRPRPGHRDDVSLEAATSATRIEPRMRERRIAVRRRRRKRLKWLAVVTRR